MSFEIAREQRTRAFNMVGILECGRILESIDVPNPSDQMKVVYHFLSKDDASAGNRDRPHQWVEAGLGTAALSWRSGNLSVTWPNVLASKGPIRWAPEREFGSLLSVRYGGEAIGLAARRLRKAGVEIDWATLIDLRDDFTEFQLPRAVHTFDPNRGAGKEAHWLSTLFYRYALRTLRSDRVRREQLDLLLPTYFPSTTPEDALLEAERDSLGATAIGTLASLSSVQRMALEMYFGIADREWSLREIGAAIGTNRFKARTLVLQGLAQMAFASGIHDGLGEQEQMFARKLFDEGMPPMAAAKEMGVSSNEISTRLALTFRHALRARTATHSISIKGSKRTPMSAATRFYPDVSRKFDVGGYINDFLCDLKQVPTLHLAERGDDILRVDLGGMMFSLLVVRQNVTDATIDIMMSHNVPVDWLLSGPVSHDVESSAISIELEAVQNTRWQTASELLDICEEATGMVTEDRNLEVRKICTVLISVSQALDRRLPVASLMAGDARLVVERLSSPKTTVEQLSSITARWDVPEAEDIDVCDLFRRQSASAGGFSRVFADTLGQLLAERLYTADFVPDGFTRAVDHDGRVAFSRAWKRMNFD